MNWSKISKHFISYVSYVRLGSVCDHGDHIDYQIQTTRVPAKFES